MIFFHLILHPPVIYRPRKTFIYSLLFAFNYWYVYFIEIKSSFVIFMLILCHFYNYTLTGTETPNKPLVNLSTIATPYEPTNMFNQIDIQIRRDFLNFMLNKYQ